MNKHLTISTAVAGCGAAALLTTMAPAHAADAVPYTLAYTGGIGAYPRSAPDVDTRTGSALSEGTIIDAACWTSGSDATNSYGYTSSVWLRDTSGRYWPEAWLDTGSEGVPQGIASCDDADHAGAEPAWQPNCDPGGDYIDGEIVVTSTDEGKRISITPTSTAREAWGNGFGWDATVSMWHAIQDCVPGLYDTRADSVWQQLECHQRFATITKPGGSYATGPTYDLETWADPLDEPNDLNYILSHCLNESGDQYDSWLAPLRLFAITG